MNKLLQAFQNLHRAPDDWSLRDYAPQRDLSRVFEVGTVTAEKWL